MSIPQRLGVQALDMMGTLDAIKLDQSNRKYREELLDFLNRLRGDISRALDSNALNDDILPWWNILKRTDEKCGTQLHLRVRYVEQLREAVEVELGYLARILFGEGIPTDFIRAGAFCFSILIACDHADNRMQIRYAA